MKIPEQSGMRVRRYSCYLQKIAIYEDRQGTATLVYGVTIVLYKDSKGLASNAQWVSAVYEDKKGIVISADAVLYLIAL